MSLRAAINAMCKGCIYDPIAGTGTWRQQTQACTAIKCALWPVRPLSVGKGLYEGANDTDILSNERLQMA
jgi:hypothetical protein